MLRMRLRRMLPCAGVSTVIAKDFGQGPVSLDCDGLDFAVHRQVDKFLLVFIHDAIPLSVESRRSGIGRKRIELCL